jgi:hypothetical protein
LWFAQMNVWLEKQKEGGEGKSWIA